MQKPTKINLTNLSKCDQLWENMTPCEQGRVCLKCSQTIIDFRKMSDAEIAAMHTFTEGKVCGIYREEQRVLPITENLPSIKRVNRFQSIYLALVGFLSATNISGEKPLNQAEVIQTTPDYQFSKEWNKQFIKEKNTIQDSIIISGKLTNEKGEEIAFANVHVKDTKIGITSDVNGNYRLYVTDLFEEQEELILIYSYIGYKNVEVTISKLAMIDAKNRKIDVNFGKVTYYIDAFYVNPESVKPKFPKSITYRLKRFFKRKK